jgi:hypothetical protein
MAMEFQVTGAPRQTGHAITTMNATLAPRFGHTGTTTTCPLCHKSPAADVATHLGGEDDGIAEPTFALIKVLYSGWLEEHGACAACWSGGLTWPYAVLTLSG